jgi:cysteinyl-tRNA synthetase
VLERFRQEMDEDFNTPPAMAVVFDAVRQANTALDRGDGGTAGPLAAAALALVTMVGLPPKASDEIDAESAALAARRDELRAGRDYAGADGIRGQLEALGWTVRDTPGGTRLSR